MDKYDDCDVIDIIDVDAEDCDDLSSQHLPACRSESAGALVPYRQAGVPALPTKTAGDIEAFIRAANAAPMLTAEQEKELAVRLRDEGDLQAAQELIVSHLRLVVSTARGYLGYGLAHADLIQEGNIGLMKAIKHFDPDRGVRLMTFAVHWIRSEIQEYVIRNWRLVKTATTKNQRKLFFNLRQMQQTDGALSLAETYRIATSLDVKPEEVLEMHSRMHGSDTSIDTPVGSGDEGQRMAPIDWLADENQTPIERLISKDSERFAREGLKKALDQLDERARKIIFARWLTTDEEGNVKQVTLKDLAKELGVSTERVRQIELQSIKKLRAFLLPYKQDIEN